MPRSAPTAPRAALTLLWLLILAYALFFSAYTLQRHASLNTFAADLSFIDQPMWNTLHGRFLARTLDDRQVPRVAEHLEPILLPLSLVYLVWDDVRAILILQSLALALGALPVFWIARDVLGRDRRAAWLGLAFAAAYLLFPALQAANVADFHADPFVVAPLLFAFWYARQRRWRPMWAWAVLAMATKENLPTLTAMLGAYVVLRDRNVWLGREPLGQQAAGSPNAPGRGASAGLPHGAQATNNRLKPPRRTPAATTPGMAQRVAAVLRGGAPAGARHGLALMVLSVAWFLIATFVIVQPLARQVYGADAPIYLASRYIEFTGGPAGWLRAAIDALREPARLDYLRGLFASVGWLALLAPEYLLLGLPVLVANIFSNFPGQFSGEQHYSAPLAAVFVIAAIFGARRLIAFVERSLPFQLSGYFSNRTLLSAAVGLWLLTWSLGQQFDRGWTPLARPFAWPERTAHHRLLSRFTAQIPADAAVSATPGVHPHIAHRHKAYVFPVIADADFILADVPGVTDMQPTDLKATLERLLASGEFGIADAADGYVLLVRSAWLTANGRTVVAAWPDAFFDFARAGPAQPQHPLDVRFDPGLRLLGYDLVDDERWRLTRFRFYFQAVAPLPAGAEVRYQALTPAGALADDSALRPPPALLWYPPDRWQPDETVVIETVPWFLPRAWAPALTVAVNGARLRPEAPLAPPDGRTVAIAADGRVRLPAWGRKDGRLAPLETPLAPADEADARFVGAGWMVRLDAWSAPLAVAPAHELPVALHWQPAGPAPADYTVFLHLRGVTGRTVAQGDAGPTWFVPRPASTWQAAGSDAAGIWDAHAVAIPADLAPGRYDLVVGWYDWQTGDRLALASGGGNPVGDEYVLGPVTIDPLAAPRPDICCLFQPACCTSLE